MAQYTAHTIGLLVAQSCLIAIKLWPTCLYKSMDNSLVAHMSTDLRIDYMLQYHPAGLQLLDFCKEQVVHLLQEVAQGPALVAQLLVVVYPVVQKCVQKYCCK